MASFPSAYIKTVGAVDTRAADSLTFPFLARPQAMSVYVRFVESGSALVNLTGIVVLGAASNIAANWYIQVSGSNYQVTHAPVTTVSVVTSTVAVASFGESVELVGCLTASGAVQIHKSVNGGAVSSGTLSSALGLAQAWSAQTLRYNSGAGLNTGFIAIRALKILRGVFDLPTMRRKAGV